MQTEGLLEKPQTDSGPEKTAFGAGEGRRATGQKGQKQTAVSVIMPVYNGLRKSPHYLPEAIESVLAQTFERWELIIVDDGSNEDYGPLKAMYDDPRIRWVRHEKNSGQSAARNTGAAHARADILAFLDQDDRWYPKRLETGLRNFKECLMTYSDLDEIDESGAIVASNMLAMRQYGIHPKRALDDFLNFNAFILPGTVLLDKAAFLKAGGFDTMLSGFEDDDLFLRIYRMGPVKFIRTPLIQWRIYDDSYSYTERMDKSRGVYFKKLLAAYPNDVKKDRFWVRDCIAPRFMADWIGCMRKAVRYKDRKAYKRAARELIAVSRYARWRKRPIAWIVAAIPFSIVPVFLNFDFASFLKRALR